MQGIKYTREMVEEVDRCMKDPNYFIREHVGIRLTTEQKQMLLAFRSGKNIASCTERQKGKTTVQALYVLWCACFFQQRAILWGATNTVTLQLTRELIGKFYGRVPVYMKPGIRFVNNTSIEFDNETHISFQVMTENFGRGTSVSLAVLDEFAFAKHQEMFDLLIPHFIACKTQVISCSTGNPGSKFDKILDHEQFESLVFGGWHGG
jgi:hypothetical protein